MVTLSHRQVISSADEDANEDADVQIAGTVTGMSATTRMETRKGRLHVGIWLPKKGSRRGLWLLMASMRHSEDGRGHGSG